MKNGLELERRFLLVDFAKGPHDFEVTYSDISQMYIEPSVEGSVERLRAEKKLEGWKFFHTKKTPTPAGTFEEEREISLTECKLLALSRIKGSRSIEKRRYTFDTPEHTFEIDFFKDWLEGLVIWEAELPSWDTPLVVPEILQGGIEITNKKVFSNHSLATNDPSYLMWRLNQYL